MKECILTDELSHQIANSIRAGSFGHVAARAWGVSRKLYRSWLRLGRSKDAPEPYATFAAEVATASAQARLRAEVSTFKDNARAWLEHGPGREKSGDPGWTGLARPGDDGAPGAINFFELPEFMDLCRRLLEALAPFPEARARAVDALAQSTRETNSPHGENTSWSAFDNRQETTSATVERGLAADAGTAAGTTTTSPPAARAAEPG